MLQTKNPQGIEFYSHRMLLSIGTEEIGPDRGIDKVEKRPKNTVLIDILHLLQSYR